MSRSSINKAGRLYEHTNSDYSQIPKNIDMLNLFWQDLNYINEEGKLAKPSDPDPNELYTRSKYEYNSTKNKLARKVNREIFEKRAKWHKEKEEIKHKPKFSTKHYTFNPDDMINLGMDNSTPQNGLQDIGKKSYGDTGGEFGQRLDSRNIQLQYNILNRRPRFSDLTVNAIRHMYDEDEKTSRFTGDMPSRNRGIMYEDAVKMAKEIVRIRPKYDHKFYDPSDINDYYEGDYYN